MKTERELDSEFRFKELSEMKLTSEQYIEADKFIEEYSSIYITTTSQQTITISRDGIMKMLFEFSPSFKIKETSVLGFEEFIRQEYGDKAMHYKGSHKDAYIGYLRKIIIQNEIKTV